MVPGTAGYTHIYNRQYKEVKINYKNTALNLLDKWDEEINISDGHMVFSETEKKDFLRSVVESLPVMKEAFTKKIRVISAPFYRAYEKARPKLAKVFADEEMEESGTFITQGTSFTHTYFYYIKTHIIDGEWKADYVFMDFSKHAKNDFKSLDMYISAYKDSEKTFIWKEHFEHDWNHSRYLAFLVGLLCFIKYCEIETKIISGNGRGKHAGVKYVNETKSNIEVLDSTWFTTLIKSDGFMVGDETGGFFRVQPFGQGSRQRRLKWILPYEKEGYTRKAKVLNQQQ